MKKLVILIFFFYVIAFAQDLELVESIPAETTLDNPDIRNTQQVWLEVINSAQNTLDIEQFYITSQAGEPLDTILNAIVAAGKRGVKVRIIISLEMYKTYPRDVEWLESQSPNIVKHVIDMKKLAGGIQHAKFFIIDGMEVFLGSQNFDWRSLKHIHELGIRFRGTDAIGVYRGIFNADWNYCEIDDGKSWHCPIFTISKNYHIDSDLYGKWLQVLPTVSPVDFDHPNGYRDIDQIKWLIAYSSQEINLQFLSYYANNNEGYWGEVDSALVAASERGVKVKLIISDWNLSKSAIEHFKSLVSHPNFEIRYTEIPEWSGGYIPYARVEHCKFITADSTCWIGTSNMSKDYFYDSRNVGLVVESGSFTQRVRSIFYKSWDSEYAHPITQDGVYEPRKHGE